MLGMQMAVLHAASLYLMGPAHATCDQVWICNTYAWVTGESMGPGVAGCRHFFSFMPIDMVLQMHALFSQQQRSYNTALVLQPMLATPHQLQRQSTLD